ncbi:MAG: glycoside hydrolase family 66 protein [Paludibacteraceae bacterium]|nr:glycoside hydrolase family 66 protein [Paludibacteraceae bacterium]
MKKTFYVLALALACSACGGGTNNEEPTKPSGGGEVTSVMHITSDLSWQIVSDKAMYAPGEKIRFEATVGTPDASTHVRYRNGSKVIEDTPLSATTWEWTAPAEDGQGYLVEVYRQRNDTTQQIVGTIGVDVSSDWHLYPRYGFVATFDKSKTNSVIASEMAYLNRCHINGVQFQDWHYKHHWPAPVDKQGNVLGSFTDIANRMNETSVIREYIRVQHSYGMKAIFYNLAFGALDDAKSDGVKEEWYMFKDANHSSKDSHVLPSSWKSDIFLTNPGNTDWQAYIAQRNEEVYHNFDFDGYQIDQLGYRGDRYTYTGQKLNFNTAYASFINAMYKAHPAKDLIMNAVSSYCAQAILLTGHMALAYNETWADEAEYSNLYQIIKANRNYSSGKAQTVFAAYMDYNRDNCTFNIPGVLLTDAVMFAIGGAHLELGDHMLCREYFPYTGVRMSDALKEEIIHYYDFATAYENYLRPVEGDQEVTLTVTDEAKKISFNVWPPKVGKVTTFARQQNGRIVLHLLNFTSADCTSWRDIDGTMPTPRVVKNSRLSVAVTNEVKHVYLASPDYHGGALQELPFKQADGKVSFTVPTLKYWDMLIFE